MTDSLDKTVLRIFTYGEIESEWHPSCKSAKINLHILHHFQLIISQTD